MARIMITIRTGCGYKQKATGIAHGHFGAGYSSTASDNAFLKAGEGSKKEAKAIMAQKLTALLDLIRKWLEEGAITQAEADELLRKFKEENGLDAIDVTEEFEQARGIPVVIPEREKVEVER